MMIFLPYLNISNGHPKYKVIGMVSGDIEISRAK